MSAPARTGRARHLGTGLRFGAFAVVCVVLLVALAQRIGNLSFFSHRTTYEAQLADATGLQPSDAVKIAGVTVGQVTGIAVQHGHALVTFTVDDNVRLRTSTKAGLRWHNVLGQQFLYLYPGGTGAPLRPGATIPLANDVASASVGALLNALGPFLSAVNPQQANTFLQSVVAALDGNETKVNGLIADAATVSQTVGSLDGQVGRVIGDLDQVLTALAHRSSDVSSLLTNLQSVAKTLADHNAVLDSVVGNLAAVTGEFAGVIRSNQGTLSTSIADLQSVTAEVQAHEAALSQGLGTLGSGLAPYAEISAFGQWFQIQTVYTCLAGETACTYIDPANPPAGSAAGGAVLPALPGTTGTTPLTMLENVAGAGGGS
ncbi:MAG: MCE family protein [Actinomycetota bacterium]|jgi:phospholipid/cholesterol/gamma-HCH transport system substrate-binding protein|nr:MCE family protein [Actinomycetota bacterium]